LKNEATEEFVDFTLEILRRLDMGPGSRSLCHCYLLCLK